MSHEIKGTSQSKAQEPASALRYCTRCGAPFAAEDDDDGDLCGRCCLEPTSLTLLQMELNKLKKQRDTSQDMLLQATKQCDELKAKLAEKDEAQELLENERKLSAEFRRRLETVERMLKDSEACLADARAELERAQKREAVLQRRLWERVENCCQPDGSPDEKWGGYCTRCQVDLAALNLAALQPDAGSDYIHKHSVKPLVAAIERGVRGTPPGTGAERVLYDALQHAKSLGLL